MYIQINVLNTDILMRILIKKIKAAGWMIIFKHYYTSSNQFNYGFVIFVNSRLFYFLPFEFITSYRRNKII